jgi:four helix bundle protein
VRAIRQYDVFRLADSLVILVYRATRRFPREETFGLAAQMRRAALSVPLNLVEGAARASGRDFAHFVDMALGSCEEVRYQVQVACQLGYMEASECRKLDGRYENVAKMLNRLRGLIRGSERRPLGGRRTARGEGQPAKENLTHD